ncbi:myelin P2 protein-like [Notolabrus celidotus]|uniref:myelin P2 protein-like n=1 Tax=Notolabrus celidotus TaxID=1203425 RepID=UPI00148FF482|nr:myelin P2 protein-like [Notolabrus celidotus]
MVKQFVGNWTLASSENFDEYMKAIVVGFATRQMGNMAKPNLVISVEDSGVISLKSVPTFKTTEIKFKLNEEFEETIADNSAPITAPKQPSSKSPTTSSYLQTGHLNILILLDLTDAFDSINNTILLSCLESQLDITGTALSWL